MVLLLPRINMLFLTPAVVFWLREAFCLARATVGWMTYSAVMALPVLAPDSSDSEGHKTSTVGPAWGVQLSPTASGSPRFGS